MAEQRKLGVFEMKLMRAIMVPFSKFQASRYRKSAGQKMGTLQGRDICLVTMKGRKTGRWRTIPLIYIPNREDVILVASQGGLDFHPVWYRNLLAEPEIEIEEGSQKRKMSARRANDDEKRELWPHILML